MKLYTAVINTHFSKKIKTNRNPVNIYINNDGIGNKLKETLLSLFISGTPYTPVFGRNHWKKHIDTDVTSKLGNFRPR